MSLEDMQMITNTVLIVGLFDLIFFILIGFSIISMSNQVKLLVDLFYKKEENGKNSISSESRSDRPQQ